MLNLTRISGNTPPKTTIQNNKILENKIQDNIIFEIQDDLDFPSTVPKTSSSRLSCIDKTFNPQKFINNLENDNKSCNNSNVFMLRNSFINKQSKFFFIF